MSRKSRRSGRKRSYTIWIIPVLVIVTGVVGYYIFTQSGVSSGCSLCNTPASPAVLSDLNGVSTSTLNSVGSGAAGIASPTAITGGSALTVNGKPEILYMGAEYCPYCGAERWAMIVALDKFGSFTGIDYMQSSATDVYANTPTFTFVNATYSSSYIAFVSVEETDRNQALAPDRHLAGDHPPADLRHRWDHPIRRLCERIRDNERAVHTDGPQDRSEPIRGTV